MATNTLFKFGDRVVHPARPEWGIGIVTAAQSVRQGDEVFQRLTLRFERAGLKTLTTQHVQLTSADHAELPAPAASAEAESPFEGLSLPEQAAIMARLPEATRDPFSTPEARLRATAALYRFESSGSSLLDWASAQTGLKDPLSQFSRHELEQFFERFRIERDQHLRKVLAEVRKSDPDVIVRVSREAPPTAREAMRRLHTGR